MKKALLLLTFLPLMVFGQGKLQTEYNKNGFLLLRADSYTNNLSGSMFMNGNIFFKIGAIEVRCDSADYNPKDLLVNAFGNVKCSGLASDAIIYSEHIRFDIPNNSTFLKNATIPWNSQGFGFPHY